MGFAAAAQHGLSGAVVVADGECRIFDHEAVQHGREAVLVGLLRRGDRHAVDGVGQCRHGHDDGCALGAERVAGAGVGELGDGDDVARGDRVEMGLGAADERGEMVQPFLRPRARVDERVVDTDRPRQHLQHRDLSEEVVDRRLEHERERLSSRVGGDVDGLPGCLDDRRSAVTGRGADPADEVGELIGTDRRRGRSAQHRERQRAVDGVVEQVLELFRRRFVAGQVPLEEVVVELDHVLDEVLVLGPFQVGEVGRHVDPLGVSGVVHERVVGEQVGDAVEARLRADRQLGGVRVRSEHLAHLGERSVERRSLTVELVDEDDPGQAQLGSVTPQHHVL